MGSPRSPMTLFCIGCSVLLLAQRPPVKAIDPPPEPPRLYWPGGLPPYHLMPPYEEPPMPDDRPLTMPDSVRSIVDVAPSFPGGEVALRAYLQDNLVYPELALEVGSEGNVRVVFVVWPDGHLTDVRVPEGESHPELHQEALRLMKRMPNWVPAQVNGSVVAANASILIPFRIRY